uniref:MATH domain-containing protein n=1 Tax=Globodera pallida TaxID=36090 RepID=A0A183BPL9_GLOPA
MSMHKPINGEAANGSLQQPLCRPVRQQWKEDHIQEISRHIFNLKENKWGIKYFMGFEELMDPQNGWYDAKNDTVILSAKVTAEEPIGVE